MKKRILPLLAPTLLLLSALLAGCNKDETDANRLPNGKHPLTLTATVEGLTATRATTNNTWTGGEKVAVIIDNASVQKYTAAADGALAAPSNVTPYYWQSTDERKSVLAWVPYSDTKPTTFTVKANQSGDGYAQSDMLWSSQQISYHNSTLTFKHLPAKVVVNLKSGDGVTAADVAGATVTLVNQNLTSGKIDADWKVETAALGSAIIPYNNVLPATTDFQKIVQALVVPQQMKGKQFIKVEIITGTAAGNYYYTPTGNADANLESGKQHTYNITVQKTGLKVTAKISNWKGGAGGSGTSGAWYPVYTPPTNGDERYPLSDGDKIMIAGSGTKTFGSIVIYLPGAKTSVTVVLSNVNIEAVTPIEISGPGTATILLNDTQNRLSSLSHGGCGLRISGENTHVIINGPGTLTAVGANVGAAIGSFSTFPCGDITIKDAVINATAVGAPYAGAAIGAGDSFGSSSPSSCGNITIINSDITASVTAREGSSTGAAIGAGSGNSFHGDISITLKKGQTQDDFLNKLTVGSGAEKVGKGANNTSSSCGAITWHNNANQYLKD